MQLSLRTFLFVQAVSAFGSLWSRATTPQSYVTNNNGTYQLSTFTAPVAGSGTAPSGSTPYTLQVVDTTTKQSVVGFGAAVTDATTSVISGLSAAMQKQLWTTILTPSGSTSSGYGANFSLFRHTIGASDLSADPAYTYDDNNGTADPKLSNFALGTRGTLMAQTLQIMKTFNPTMRILGTPWSPPGWMKNNKLLTGGDPKTNTLNPTYYNQHAQYFVQYLKKFSAYVNIDAITIQNEPLNDKKYLPSMNVSADEATNLIKNYIGPAIQSISPVPQIWAWDLNTDKPEYPATVLEGAGSYVQATAWHCYKPASGWTPLTAFHQQFPGHDQYMTECATTDGAPWYGASDFVIGPLQNWANGSMAWTLATNTSDGPYLNNNDSCHTCQGLIIVDTTAGTYRLTTNFYTMAQYSRWMPRGALVMDVNGGVQNSTGSVRAIASRNPDGATNTVVLHNTFDKDLYMTVTFASGAQSYSGLVVKQSITTWVLPK